MLAARLQRESGPVHSSKSPKREGEDRNAADALGGGALGDFLKSKEGKRIEREVFRGVFGMLRKRL
jgi:hypothetical protein